MSSTAPAIESSNAKTSLSFDPANFGTILTRVSIRTLCPLLHCEVQFSQLSSDALRTPFPSWSTQAFSGDLEGFISMGCTESTLKTIAKTLKIKTKSGALDLKGTREKIFQSLISELFKQLEQDAFVCHPDSAVQHQIKFTFQAPTVPSTLSRIDTKYGSFTLQLALSEKSTQLIDDQFGSKLSKGLRKIRVNSEQLDILFDRLNAMEVLEGNLSSSPDIRRELRSEIKRLKRIVIKMKTEPVDLLFAPAKRVLLELAKEQGKQVTLEVSGSPVHLDKALLNHLYSPVLHLIRNAIDHGIESPIERERIGKPPSGLVKCIASFSENGLKLLVSDDGRGLDFQSIRERAVSLGLLTAREATQKLSSELYPLLFSDCFSTKKADLPYSGQGLGLSVVQKELRILGGNVRILSTSHHGTAFELSIPLNKELGVINPKQLSEPSDHSVKDEQSELEDEVSNTLARMQRLVDLIKSEKNPTVAGETYRLLHSIRGIAGYLHWNKVVTLSYQFEELLKAISEQKVTLSDHVLGLLDNSLAKLSKLCEASKKSTPYSGGEIKTLQSNILKVLWNTQSDPHDKALNLANAHRHALSSLTQNLYRDQQIQFKKETEFEKVFSYPFGTVLQTEGDKHGYIAVLLPELSVFKLIQPLVSGNSAATPLKGRGATLTQLETLNDFSYLLGRQIFENVKDPNLTLQFGSPLSYFGSSDAFQLLGYPTYCYGGELKGYPIYLLGRDSSPGKTDSKENQFHVLPFLPSLLLKEIGQYLEKKLSKWEIEFNWNDYHKPSAHLGFNDGFGVLIRCNGKLDALLSIHFEKKLLKAILKNTKSSAQSENQDFGQFLTKLTSQLIESLQPTLSKGQFEVQFSSPTYFLGGLRLPDMPMPASKSCLHGETPFGNFEIQLISI